MRENYSQELLHLRHAIRSMAGKVATAMEHAAEALRNGDLVLAEQVIDDDEEINELQREIDEQAVTLLARQAPVAGDLRMILSAMRVAQTLERQGDLARHVARIARSRYPESPVPEPIFSLLVEMADYAAAAGREVVDLVGSNDLNIAMRIEDNDAKLDELQRRTYRMAVDEQYELTRQQVIDATLLGRFLERFGDHSTSVARRVGYIVNGVLASTRDDDDQDAMH